MQEMIMEVQVEVDADSRSKELHINADSRSEEPHISRSKELHINADSRSEEPQGDADGKSKPQGDADGESKPQGDADGESKPHLVQKDLWGKKYKVLKRKCEEFEQFNEALFHRAKRIHQMIERAEAEKRFLVRRLEQYEAVEFSRASEEERTCSEVPAESALPEVKGVGHKASAPPPALLGPFLPDEQEENGVLSPGASGSELPIAYIPTMPNSNHMDSSNGLPAADIAAMPTSTTPRGTASKTGSTATATTLPPAKGRTTATKSGAAAGSKKPAAAKQKRAPKAAADPKLKKNSPGGARRRKADTDPNQPKKPSNSFFWFCQEHRPSLQERFRGEGVQGQHDLTKILAKLWSETTPEDKKKYYDLYAVDKKRYDRQMQEYVAKGQRQQFAKLLLDSLTGTESEKSTDHK